MQLIKPSDTLVRKYKKDTFDNMRIFMYNQWLRFLAKKYKRCAISDNIKIGSQLTVVHEVRDLAFESEMQRLGFDVKPKLVVTDLPNRINVRYKPTSARWFNLKNLLTIHIDNKEIALYHANEFVVSGNLNAKTKLSVMDDIIARSSIQLPYIQPIVKELSANKSVKSINMVPQKITKTGLFMEEVKTIKNTELIIDEQIIKDTESQQEPQNIKKKGFTIDTSF